MKLLLSLLYHCVSSSELVSLSCHAQAGGGGCSVLHRECAGAEVSGEAGPEHGGDLGAEEVMGTGDDVAVRMPRLFPL